MPRFTAPDKNLQTLRSGFSAGFDRFSLHDSKVDTNLSKLIRPRFHMARFDVWFTIRPWWIIRNAFLIVSDRLALKITNDTVNDHEDAEDDKETPEKHGWKCFLLADLWQITRIIHMFYHWRVCRKQLISQPISVKVWFHKLQCPPPNLIPALIPKLNRWDVVAGWADPHFATAH